MKKVFIIAEAGVNHNGDLDIAHKLVDAAVEARADAVKFQTFSAQDVVVATAQKAAYQKNDTDSMQSQLQMLKKLELNEDDHRSLLKHCQKEGIIFLSTPFDHKSIDMLVDLGLDIFKIPSGEITNLPYLRKIGSLNKKVILSTGISDMQDIKEAFKIITESGTSKENISILHCNTQYPTPYDDVNLRAMLTIQKYFDVEVGYSDHTLGIEVPIAAVALGAVVVEKHFTLSRSMRGPDHAASLEPDELKMMVSAIRKVERALGSGEKTPTVSELQNKKTIRRGVVAARDIHEQEVFTDQNIVAKRPAVGMSPMLWDKIIGKVAKRNFNKDEFIEL